MKIYDGFGFSFQLASTPPAFSAASSRRICSSNRFFSAFFNLIRVTSSRLGLLGVLPKGLLNGELKFVEENDAKDGTFRSPAPSVFVCDCPSLNDEPGVEAVESMPGNIGRGFELVRGVEGRSSGVDGPFEGGDTDDAVELAKLGSFPSAHS